MDDKNVKLIRPLASVENINLLGNHCNVEGFIIDVLPK
jgi:hypothetical protein